MKNKTILILKIFFVISIIWLGLTVFAQFTGGEKTNTFGDKGANQNALVVYNPDPFYNLDEQVSNAFAERLAEHQWLVKVATVTSAKKLEEAFDLYIFVANTYNWAPDWGVNGFIKNYETLDGKTAVAITLGSGSTTRSKRLLEATIQSKNAYLLESENYWLLRPNDESRMDESNVSVSLDMAKELGTKVGHAMAAKISYD
jgi:hypothetical protein